MSKEKKKLEERAAKIWETIKQFEYKEYSFWTKPNITNSKIITEYPEFIIYAIHPKYSGIRVICWRTTILL